MKNSLNKKKVYIGLFVLFLVSIICFIQPTVSFDVFLVLEFSILVLLSYSYMRNLEECTQDMQHFPEYFKKSLRKKTIALMCYMLGLVGVITVMYIVQSANNLDSTVVEYYYRYVILSLVLCNIYFAYYSVSNLLSSLKTGAFTDGAVVEDISSIRSLVQSTFKINVLHLTYLSMLMVPIVSLFFLD